MGKEKFREQELRLVYKFLKEKYPNVFFELSKYILVNINKDSQKSSKESKK